MMRQLGENLLVSGQVMPSDIGRLAEQGVTVLVNNRPDGEEIGQPLSSAIQDAALAAGIAYYSVPILRGIGPADVQAMQEALHHAQGGKLLAFCRSGMRSALVIALAKRENGAAAEDVRQELIGAGFDPAPIVHLL